MEDKRTEYVSLRVTPEDKKRLNELQDNHAQQLSIINEIFDKERRWKKGELEQLEEEVLQYRALLSKVREKFNEAYQEHLTKQEEFWDKLYTGLPTFQDKVSVITKQLVPITESIKQVHNALESVNKYRIEDLLKIVDMVSNLRPEQLAMFNMLVENFKTPKQ